MILCIRKNAQKIFTPFHFSGSCIVSQAIPPVLFLTDFGLPTSAALSFFTPGHPISVNQISFSPSELNHGAQNCDEYRAMNSWLRNPASLRLGGY